MKGEVRVIQENGSVAAQHGHLVEQLRREAAQGQVRVNAYQGVGD